MPNPFFKFKQFTVWHDKCAMKVGTDGVLLGAWSDVKHATHVLDIGTGSGLIALMIAQRSNAEITAIDIDRSAVQQAKENAAASPWDKRIHIKLADFKDFEAETGFDAIVSNPPFFSNALASPNLQRTQARHNQTLNFENLINKSSALLSPNGNLSMIIPAESLAEIRDIAAHHHLFATRQLHIITSPGKPLKRTLIEFRRTPRVNCPGDEMILEIERHKYSREYIELTKSFYLNM